MQQDITPSVIPPDGPRQIKAPQAAEEFDKTFRPKGAMAFFVLLVILGLVIWYGIYFLMLERI